MFEDGIAYVALSQVRTLDGVALLDLVANKIKALHLCNRKWQDCELRLLVAIV